MVPLTIKPAKKWIMKFPIRFRNITFIGLIIIVWTLITYSALHTPAPFKGLPPEKNDHLLSFGSIHQTKREKSFLEKKDWLQLWHSQLRRSRAFFVDLSQTKYAYCSIGKAGCTIHIGIIRRLYGEKQYEYLPVVHNNSANARFLSYNLNPKRIQQNLLDDQFPKYVIVRNPLTRTLSAYRNKVESTIKNKTERTPANFHKWVFQNFKNFNQQTSYEQLSKWNIHWMPQYIQCGMNQARFFKVFKFEQPETYLQFLTKILPNDILDHGWGDERNLSLHDYHFIPRNRTGHVEEKFYKYYNKLDVFDRVSNIFQRDIEMFDYQEEVAQMRTKVIQNRAK